MPESDAWSVDQGVSDRAGPKLQALVYDILLSTTAIVDYAIGLESLSANEQEDSARRWRLYTYRYFVITRMTPALRWAAMRVILMFN